MSPENVERKPWILVSALMAAGLVLRCAFLAKDSLWLDEFVSWVCASRDGFWGVFFCDINKPPLYYPLLKAWMAIFGHSEVALRALSIPPGVVSIGLVYVLVRKLFSRPVAYLAAGYQAISTFQIYYAQEARNYTWLVLFLLLAGIFLWEAIGSATRGRRIGYYIAYSVAITLALYTHYFAIFFIAGHGLYVLFRRPRQLLPAAASITVAVALIIPWLMFMLRTPGSTEDQLRKYLFLKFPQAYFSFLFGDTLIPLDANAVRHVRQTLAAGGWILALSLGSLAVFLPYLWSAWKRWREPFLYALVNATVPIFLAFFVSFKKMLFDERYMIPSSPYVYALIAAAIWEIVLYSRSTGAARSRSYLSSAAVGAYCLLLVVSLYNYYFAARFGREQWREAIAYIESSSQGRQDLVAFDPDYIQMCYWYYQKQGLPIWPIDPRKVPELTASGAVLRDHVRGFRTVWLVRSHSSGDEVWNVFHRMLPQRSYRNFPKANGIEVYAFDIPSNLTLR